MIRQLLGRAVSWRARRLMFPGDPVSAIADEFNRYNKTQIRIEGADLQTRRMSGVFNADDPSPLLRYLEGDPGVEVVRERDAILIRSRLLVSWSAVGDANSRYVGSVTSPR